MRVKMFILTLAIFATLILGGCTVFFLGEEHQGNGLIYGRVVKIEATGYCPCGSCCSWKRDRFGHPVISVGHDRGKPKAVGITACGTRVRPGTIAADTRYYPMGTVIFVPGYGYGVVEDCGGDIRGRHRLDLFFNAHQEARNWGRKKLEAVVFPPGTPVMPKNALPPR